MFRRRKDAEQEPTHRRYYLQKVKLDVVSKESDKAIAQIQRELDAGAEKGWELVATEFTNLAPTLLLWDTEPPQRGG